MSTPSPSLLVVTGLQREAQIAAGDGVVTMCSGGNPQLLRNLFLNISHTLTRPHPEEAAQQPSRRMRPPTRTRVFPSSELIARKSATADLRSFETPPAAAPQDEGGERAQIKAVLSFGLAGGLHPDLRTGDVVIASHIIASNEKHDAHADWCVAVASALGKIMRVHRGAIAGHDSVLTQSSDKAALHAQNGALAVDMESHIAAAYARQHGLPFAVIRVISDPVTRSLPEIATNALKPDGSVDLSKVIGGILRNPGQLPALIAAGIDSERAFSSLRRCRRLLGPLFGFRPADF